MSETATGRLYSAWTDIEIGADGIQAGNILVAQSTDRSAYQALRVPFMSIRNGPGPSTLLMAGNHGDEHEGQIVLSEIAARADLASLTGEVFLMPRANAPACATGTRTSPLDGGNFNIAFPGQKGGGATAQIAHFLEETILPRVDLWLDLHSGGRSLIYEPLAAMHVAADRALNRTTVDLLRIFGAPTNLLFTIQEARAASSAAQRHGVNYIYGEYGGGAAMVSRAGIDIATRGVERVLAARHGYRAPDAPVGAQRWCRIDANDYRETRKYYFFAAQPGIWAASRDLGAPVTKGDVVGRLYPEATPFGPGVDIVAKAAGRLVSVRSGPLVSPGDCLGHLAQPTGLEEILADYC
jgi:predicted deacylase